MNIEDVKVGQQVEHESDDNGPIWRGTVEEVRANGLVYVKWDDRSCGLRTYMSASVLNPSDNGTTEK